MATRDGITDISVNVFREAPIDDLDPTAVARRDDLRRVIFALFFGSEQERGVSGGKTLPFAQLAPEAIAAMSDGLRGAYEAELAAAMDSRSGRLVRPYIPPGVIQSPR